MSKKVVKMEEKREESKVNLDENITRREFMDILSQVSENINQISEYLMQDVNAMYSQHVFPLQIRCGVYEELLIENGILSTEDIEKRVNNKINDLRQKAEEELKKQKEESPENGSNENSVSEENVNN